MNQQNKGSNKLERASTQTMTELKKSLSKCHDHDHGTGKICFSEDFAAKMDDHKKSFIYGMEYNEMNN